MCRCQAPLLIILLCLGFSTVQESCAQSPNNSTTWMELIPQLDTAKGAVAGVWTVSGSELSTNAATSSRLLLPIKPQGDYDFLVEFTRQSGVHSIALIFTSGGGQATFEIDAWGQHLAGIQNIRGRTFQDNPTRRPNITLQNGRKYSARVEVRGNRVRTLLDEQVIATYESQGKDLSLFEAWKLPDEQSLGIGAYEAATTFHRIAYRQVASTTMKPSLPATLEPQRAPLQKIVKPVVIVIANQHFFYREYAEPKAELMRAGFRVVTAAGRRGPCRPHENSGQNGDGTVQAEIAISEINADDYSAIVFSGGWGSSMYQYAFTGRYNTDFYNGEPSVKSATNRVIEDFAKQDKWIGALCHGVSVLAWSRQNQRSLLAGKNVAAAETQGPQGIYNGRQDQPPSLWNAQQNGARVASPSSMGDPNSPHDDVIVDGKIITAADDRASRHFGLQLVRLLNPS